MKNKSRFILAFAVCLKNRKETPCFNLDRVLKKLPSKKISVCADFRRDTQKSESPVIMDELKQILRTLTGSTAAIAITAGWRMSTTTGSAIGTTISPAVLW